ncbi:SpoIID/LytB domain-containing protein [Thermoanaerobacterium thermosaccharolyticum]|uniref:SpoIID/LytB domain-containing protein n=1 Tax=Thermoanaerobacterium thermosaccharolyticum TaxID=1517 RepID=UPI0017858082|nr:SpoIID/LytB domain-containing protein [Thermoanaerobacterium thermosaccharolyticum]
MRSKKYVAVFLLFLLVLTSTLSYANASIEMPSLVKIGLFYGSSSLPSYSLSSVSGFKLGTNDNSGNIKYVYNIASSSVQVMKDDNYYLQEGNFQDQAMADNEQSKISSSIPNSIVGYDGSFHIYFGPYSNQSDANSAMKSLIAKFPDIKIVSPNKNIVIAVNGKIVFLYAESNTFYLMNLTGDSPISINGKRYRAYFEFIRQQGSDMTAINVLPLEEYLYGVVPAEMPASWNIEALKAQAVAARTYAVYNLGKYSKYGFDLTNDVNCQAYNGFDGENPNSNKAVDDTKGVIAIYNGKPIDAIFHSHSGGYTEDSENVYSNSVPYLRGVEDKYVFGYNESLDNWSVNVTTDSIEQKLKSRGVDIGHVINVKVTDKSWTGRAIQVTIYGDKGNYILNKNDIRSFFNLKSTMITISSNGVNSDSEAYILSQQGVVKKSLPNLSVISANGLKTVGSGDIYVLGRSGTAKISGQKVPSASYTINGSGFGHGVGLSQYGARGMADHGYNYIDILKYYHKGIDVYDTIDNKTL